MLRPPSLSNILLRFGSLDFWLIILICLRYSYVFLWFLVGFHGFQGIFMLLSFPHFHFLFHTFTFNVNSTLASILSLPIVNDKKNQFWLSQYSGSHDASMSTVLLLFPYFYLLSFKRIKKINADCLKFRLPGCFNVNGALGEDSAASRGRLQATAEYLRWEGKIDENNGDF